MQINMDNSLPVNVLFVCLGNICRSPLAEGVFEKLVKDEGLGKAIRCDSAGVLSYHVGELPDPRACSTAVQYGIQLTHRARLFRRDDLDDFDYILAMDERTINTIEALIEGPVKAEVLLMRRFDKGFDQKEVPDPYYGNISGFVDVYQILERCCAALLQHIPNQRSLPA